VTVTLAGGALESRRHVCALFHTREEEYRTLIPFIREGFERGEKAIHMVDPALRADHLARLSAAGIDVRAAEGRRQLEVLPWTETHLPGGSFDGRATSARVREIQVRARAEGFRSARLIGHGDWALERPPGHDTLVEYEARMSDQLPGFDDPVVCVYDRSRFGGSTVVDLLRAHPVSVVDGALFENPFFGPSFPFVSRLRGGGVPLLRDRFVAALTAGARGEALEIVLDDALADDVPIRTLYLDVVQASLQELGRLWCEKRITVAQEHAATEIARLALAQLRVHLPCGRSNGKHVAVACVEGELHDLGARIMADFLEMAGFAVQFLGANVPTETLASLVRQRPADGLALSATATQSLGALRRAIGAVRAAAGPELPVFVGGHLFLLHPELAAALGVPCARSADEGVAIARRLLGTTEQSTW
jgi:MerR family transcriptional regulator, light-induced transcriptional regulator